MMLTSQTRHVQETLEAYIKDHPDFIQPEGRRNEVNNKR